MLVQYSRLQQLLKITIVMQFPSEQLKNFLPTRAEQKPALEKKFVDSFMVYVKSIYQGSNEDSMKMKYNLRQDLFNMESVFMLSSIQYKGRAVSSFRPDCYEKCARLTTCLNYHFFCIDEIFKKMCEKNEAAFTCPSCNTKITQTREIIPDYLSYLYYAFTEGLAIKLNFNKELKEEISEALRTEIIQSTNKVYIKNTIVTIVYDNYSPQFQKLIKEGVVNEELLDCYTDIKSEKNLGELRLSANDGNRKFNSLGTTSFGLISLINGKRIRSGVLHADCKHQEIYIFDLEGLITSLIAHTKSGAKTQPKESVKCLFCNSAFTKENLREKAIFFNKISSIILQQPYSCGRVYFVNNVVQPKAEEREFIKKEERLQAQVRIKFPDKDAQFVKKKVDSYLKDLTAKSVGFWGMQDREKSQQFFKQVVDKVNKNKDQKEFLMTIDYKKMFYPVRCKSCHKLDCVDLWQYLIHFIKLKELESVSDFKCIICKKYQFDEDEDDLQKFIYLDIQVYTLMQSGLLKIGYYFALNRWLPDIKEIAFRENINCNPLTFITNFLRANRKEGDFKTLKYYRNNFEIKNMPRDSECFIIESCNNREDIVQKHKHIIFIQKQIERCSFKCPECGGVPSNILDLLFDAKLEFNIRQGLSQWSVEANDFMKDLKVSKIGKKIRIIEDVSQLDFIREVFDKEVKKLEKELYNPKNKGWNRKEIDNYAGGVEIFSEDYVEMIKIA